MARGAIIVLKIVRRDQVNIYIYMRVGLINEAAAMLSLQSFKKCRASSASSDMAYTAGLGSNASV